MDYDELIECRLKGSNVIIDPDKKNIKIIACYFEDSLLTLNQPNQDVYTLNNIFINTDLNYQPFMRWLESKCHI